jgi:hypothetical protein
MKKHCLTHVTSRLLYIPYDSVFLQKQHFFSVFFSLVDVSFPLSRCYMMTFAGSKELGEEPTASEEGKGATYWI